MENHHYENEGQFQRKMTSRHLFMLSLGGVIGTGLFLSSGFTIGQAGPFGAVLSYIIGAVVVYLVMLSLGELAVAMPVTGSFHTYATRFISPAAGFTVAWLYWLCWTVALGSEFLGAGLLMQRWFPAAPAWFFAAIFATIVFALNALSVRLFAEAEFYFSSIKVITIILFILLGGAAIFGLIPIQGYDHAPLFSNLTAQGLFPNGVLAVVSVMLAVNYAFSGTELIGIAAGETDNPQEAVPKAIKTTIGRLVIFFVLTIVVLACLLPMKEAGVSQAPFVAVFDKLGIPYAADVMNFVILTAILSAGNSGLYASSRMLWSLANEGMISKKVVRINKQGVPMRALLLSMVGALLSLLASVFAADTVFIALVSIAGFAVVVVWLSIPLAQINFRKEFLKSHKESELTFKTPFNPVLPWITIALLIISVIGMAFDKEQQAGLIFGLPFTILCYSFYSIRSRFLAKRSRFLETLSRGEVLVLDGALGTELESRGYDVSGNLWSGKYLLADATPILDIHKDYLKAGADVLTSSSYQASPHGLVEAGLSELDAERTIEKSVALARQAIEEVWSQLSVEEKKHRVYPFIAGSVGPFGAYLADGSEYRGDYDLIFEEYVDFHRLRLEVLIAQKVDVLALETIPNLHEAKALLDMIQDIDSQIPVYLSVSLQSADKMADGSSVEDLAKLVEHYPQVVAVGANCSKPEVIDAFLENLDQVTDRFLIAYPNSGEVYHGDTHTWHESASDQSLLEFAKSYHRHGAQLIGGCCRTRPSDIQELANHFH